MKKLNIKFNLSLKIFLLIFIVCVCTLIGLIINTSKEDEILLHQYVSNYINFTYDDTFSIFEENDYVKLTTQDKETNIVIKKLDYTSNNKTKDKYEISSSLSYQVVKDNKNYIETYNGNEDNKYYYLYENYNENNQIEVINIFEGDYIYVIIFSAKSNEFDLYKESIDIIINSIYG